MCLRRENRIKVENFIRKIIGILKGVWGVSKYFDFYDD